MDGIDVDALWLIVFAALFIITLTAISNAVLFPRLRTEPAPTGVPRLSVLIPARNEAAVIGETVRALLAQSYRDFELIVLDDHSSDGTAEVARRAADGDPRLRVISGADLPSGWGGKNWACQQLSEAACGDWLLFTDADVRWQSGALAALIGMAERTHADLLTVWPTQETRTWPERLVVPLMAFAIFGYLPILPVHHTRIAAFAAANGQCMLFRRAAYQAVGGHAAVRANVVEDVSLARRIKAAGRRLRMADGAGLIGCRMYTGWPAVRDGFAKNILAGHGGSLPFLALSTVFHWLVFIAPPAALILSVIGGGAGIAFPAALTALGVGVRALTAVSTRQRPLDAVFMPLSVFLMTVIAARSAYWQLRYGGPRWKGRTLPSKNTQKAGIHG